MQRSFRQLFSARAGALLRLAVREDVGEGDITSRILVPKEATAKAAILARGRGIMAGGPVLREIFRIVDPDLKATLHVNEGKAFRRHQAVVHLEGRVRSILRAERVALNFLAHMAAIATQTQTFVRHVHRNSVLILDTRKTMPLLREFEKYAVRMGGGKNHRMGLYDAIFVKENHRPFGQLEKLKRYRKRFEIEVRNFKELKEALALSPRIILFDNFRPAELRKAVRIARATKPEIILEASGGITLHNVAHYAALGVDWISVGALTHSVPSLDFSLLID